jgi:hypothetical protein
VPCASILHFQDFFPGIFNQDPVYRANRGSFSHPKLFLVSPCKFDPRPPQQQQQQFWRFKEIARLKGIPDKDVRKDLWRKKARILKF